MKEMGWVSFLFLFLFASSCLFPGEVLVLDVLDGVVESDEFFLFVFLFFHFPPFLFFSFQFSVLFILVPLLEYFQLLIGSFNQFIQFINLLVEFVFALLGFGSQFLRFLFDVHIFPVQVLFQLLVHQCLCLYRWLQVFYFYRKRLFRLLKYPSLIGQFGLCLFVEVTDFYFRFLAFVHEALFKLLDSGHVFGDLFLVLFGLSHFFLLQLFDFHVKFFLFFHESAHLVLAFEFVGDESLEFGGGIGLDEFD